MEPESAHFACPTCGHRTSQALEVCPKCARDSANPFVSPAIEAAVRSPEWRWIAAMALGLCILCGALAFVAPGVAVLLLVLASPVLARAWAMVERRREAGFTISGYERVQAIIASSGMLIVAGLAGAIACVAVCLPLGIASTVLPPSISDMGAIMAFSSGGIAGLVACLYVMRRHWPKRNSDVKTPLGP
jgi:hypothetical protein